MEIKIMKMEMEREIGNNGNGNGSGKEWEWEWEWEERERKGKEGKENYENIHPSWEKKKKIRLPCLIRFYIFIFPFHSDELEVTNKLVRLSITDPKISLREIHYNPYPTGLVTWMHLQNAGLSFPLTDALMS